MARGPNKTPDEVFAEALQQIDSAKRRYAVYLQLGKGRRSFQKIPNLSQVESLLELNLAGTGIQDLGPLTSLPNLTILNISDTPVHNIAPLSSLKTLRQLTAWYTSIRDLSPLIDLTNLRSLTIGNLIQDITPLRNLRGLTELTIASERISSLEALRGNRDLRVLRLHAEFPSLEPIAELENLEELSIRSTNVESLHALRNMKMLKSLDISGCHKISDISLVNGMSRLEYLGLARTQVRDLSPIANLTGLADASVNIKSWRKGLDTHRLPISDRVLADLLLQGNPERTVEAINHLRRQLHLPEYFPVRYMRSGVRSVDGPEGVGDPPEVPPPRPAAVEPIWQTDGRLGLPSKPAESDLESESIDAALVALKVGFVDLADDADEAGNIDRRATQYLRRLAERIPADAPTQDELFRIAHVEDLLKAYGSTVNSEWPDFLASTYHALALQFGRTMRQFPRWREFKRNADKDQLSTWQIDQAVAAAVGFVTSLRDASAQEFVDPILPEALTELSEPVVGDAPSLPNSIEAGAELLAEDLLESINNTLKALSEAALKALEPLVRSVGSYSKALAQGFDAEAVVRGARDGRRLFKWVRALLLAGTGIGTAWLTGLLSAFPTKFGWLITVIEFLSKLAG